MHVKLLGTAAGGAFPQWNCACRNCVSVRKGSFQGKARCQLQIAVSPDGESWFLLNASPDIRAQIERDSAFHPLNAVRSTPISGVVLTSADLDQVLGLLMLREFQEFRIYATPTLQQILRNDNSMFAVLNRVPDQVAWIDILPGHPFPLSSRTGKASLCCTPVSLGDHVPAFVPERRQETIIREETLLGLIIQSASGRRLGYFPAVPELTPTLLQELEPLDVILFDGTFWSDDELSAIRGAGPTSREIGHIPISGEGGSLQLLSGLRGRKIYVHINNTNPILDESGAEYRQVREAGWEVGEDGWEFKL
jgi:pyrroloquinoline quinone biosynthesis protein B